MFGLHMISSQRDIPVYIMCSQMGDLFNGGFYSRIGSWTDFNEVSIF